MLEIEDEKAELGTIIRSSVWLYVGDRLLRPSFVGISKKKVKKMIKILKNIPCRNIFRPHIKLRYKGKIYE